MSDKPISVGDLVVVVKPLYCCGADHGVGFHFVVRDIHPGQLAYCQKCGKEDQLGDYADSGEAGWCDLSRLKRIPPLEELEGEKRDEKLTELA